MISVRLFQSGTAILLVLFVWYGMDVRRKEGSAQFVRAFWLALMKACSFGLIVSFVALMIIVKSVSVLDWMALACMTSGTLFVAAAKRSLGTAHTFTGQYLRNPRLVTSGIYASTRNPLYFGVFQCEIGGFVFVMHQTHQLWPERFHLLLMAFGVMLLYAVMFNVRMSAYEARYLEDRFGNHYRLYAKRVPFLIPRFCFRKEAI